VEETGMLSSRKRNGLEAEAVGLEFIVASRPPAEYSRWPRAVNGESGGVATSRSEQEESVGKKLM
jgi:hypothetical protein